MERAFTCLTTDKASGYTCIQFQQPTTRSAAHHPARTNLSRDALDQLSNLCGIETDALATALREVNSTTEDDDGRR